MQYLDFILGPLYMMIYWLWATSIAKKNAHNYLYSKYFLKGFKYKLIAICCYLLVYLGYYGGGDTTSFYEAINGLFRYTFSNPAGYLNFMTNLDLEYPYQCAPGLITNGTIYITKGTASLTVIRIGSILNIFSLNSFVSCSMTFAFFSYLCAWRAFMLFHSAYPKIEERLVLAFLTMPSVLFWGSGVGKDSIMISMIFLLVVSYYNLALRGKNILRNLAIVIVSGFIINLIRGFMLYSLVPGLLLMTAIYYQNVFKNALVRILLGPIIIAAGAYGSFMFVQSLGDAAATYSFESLQKTAEGFKSWHEHQGGSTYTLPDFEYTSSGILKVAPVALAISLFGPFVWQVRNVVMLISALESMFLLYYAFKVFANARAYRALGIVFRDHVVLLCLPIVLVIGIAIGITSFNYGALVRYRIPIIPFFIVFLAVAEYRIRSNSDK